MLYLIIVDRILLIGKPYSNTLDALKRSADSMLECDDDRDNE